MESLSTIKIKYKDGTYSKQIPISILSRYVKWNKKNTLVDVLGEIDINTKGSVQDQLDTLFTEKIDTEQLRYYVAHLIADEVADWLDTNINPVSEDLVIIDPSLSLSGGAAEAKATGDAIQLNNAEIQELQNSLNNLSVSLTSKIDDAYVEDGFLYMVSDGEIVVGPLGPFSGGGGSGGGGGSEPSAVLTVANTSGWLSKTISAGSSCQISFNWTSIEDDLATGNGSLRILVNNVFKTSREIAQGNVTIDVSEYLSDGANTIKVQVSDVYGQMRSINYSVTVVALSISSSFETTTPFTGLIQFNYTPVGAVTKTVHFILDGNALPTQSTTVSGRQVSYSIPAQSHGGHSLKVYFDAEVNGELVKSNELYYEFMSIEEGNNTSIITSSFSSTTVDQYSLVLIPFRVYSPRSDTTAITIQINETQVSSQTVDRTEQSYSFRADTVGAKTVAIKAGSVVKTLSYTVNENPIDVQAETEDLVLYLNAQGRSNSEETRNVWKYNDISASLTNFGWRIDGWQKDSDNIDVLRLSGDARVTIPYKIFENDFKGTGKTIEIEFATREVADYNAVILSCFADNIGLKVTPQTVEFRGAQTALTTMYKDNQHLRLSITVSKQNEYRLILVYINGIISRAIQYASGQRFSQLNPVNISIGSNDCGIDIYNIRVYDNNLNRQQIVDNWIADTQDGALMLDRYARNNVYDEYGNITTSTVPTNLPYMMIEAAEWPQYKGDKKTATGSYTDKEYPTKSFTFVGCQINVQGTSSSVYYMKNIDMQFKEGFEVNSTHQDNYALRTGSIPFNRFVLKADVASIESANNTKLVMFYNDTCVYKTPEMIANPKVRWGIEGIPIVMFYYDTSTQETKFMGKYNFNLPKRAPTPYGYSGNDQSWEWQRNNSENVKFQDDDFTSMSWDELEQKEYPTWYDDFEARFPEDTFRDYSALKEFISWVKSTDRTKATGNNLPSNVTYRLNTTSTLTAYGDDNSYTVVDEMQGGVATGVKIITFTKDTPAYRLTKFRAEFPDYAEIDSAVFYYLFTEFFLMIDSRAKNMFVGFHGSQISDNSRAMTRKAVFEPYDMDTALGTNNSGVLMFSYSLEDTDTVGGVIVNGSDADVFNAQQSVLWLNVRDAYRPEITSMYRNLRTGAWSYDIVENLFEQHQSKWPEAIYNEDQYIKHLTPLLEPVTYDETTKQYIRTDRYLTMTQGSKTEQRKWWLRGRFRYFDSKYSTGDASANRITLRLFSGGTLTITPALDMYVGVYFGGGTTVSLKRAQANTPVNFVYSQSAQEMETWIDSGDLIRDVGDLSVFYPNEVDFSRAIRLKRLQIGSSESGYSNTHLTTLDVRNCGLLEYIDCSNCPNLAITVNLQGSPRLQEAYFDNTSITGVDLVDGGELEVLHLPNTITALTLLNLNKLSEFDCDGFENVTRLMLANIDPEVVDSIAILEEIPAHSQVNIQGLAIEAQDAAEISELFDLFDTMRGVSREKGANGQWIYTDYDKAQISGTIHTSSLTGAEILDFNNRYPYVTVNADHTSAQLKFYNGFTYITSVTVLDGGNGTYTGTTPTKAQDAQYTYSFTGWSKDNDNTVDSDALTAVVADRNVYACYNNTLRKYTVTFVKASADGGGTLQTINNVNYGTTITAASSYTGSTPTTTQGDATDYPFEGWNPASATVIGNTTFTAKFGSPITVPTAKDANAAYGVEWNYNNSSPTLSRRGIPRFWGSPHPATSLDGSGDSQFDEIMPWAGMKRYNIINGEVAYSEDDEGFSQTDYDTVVYIPEFYYTAYKNTSAKTWLWAVSPTPRDGYVKHPGSGRYIARYMSSNEPVNSKTVFKTKSGKMVSNIQGGSSVSAARQNGSNWFAMDIQTWSALQLLYLIEYANFDIQAMLGSGHTTDDNGPTGGTDSAMYHTLKISGADNQYRWVENPASFKLAFVHMCSFDANRNIYIYKDIRNYDSAYSVVHSGEKITEFTYPVCDLRGSSIKSFGYSEVAPWAFIPDEVLVTPDYTKYVTDGSTGSSAVTNNYVTSGGSFGSASGYGIFRFGPSAASNYCRMIYVP